MTAQDSAWIVWDHHEGMDVRDEDSGLTDKDKMERAFKAGWENAGGDQRLVAVDEIEEKIDTCCGLDGEDVSAPTNCTSKRSCWELKRLLTTLRGEA